VGLNHAPKTQQARTLQIELAGTSLDLLWSALINNQVIIVRACLTRMRKAMLYIYLFENTKDRPLACHENEIKAKN